MKFNWKNVVVGLTIILNFLAIPVASAQGTILPKAGKDCDEMINKFQKDGNLLFTDSSNKINYDVLLGCAIQTGRISLPMVPYFIRYLSNFLLGIISLIALLMVVFGGFWYTSSGMMDSKEKGKTFIKNAIMGMIYAFLAWSVVNVILAAITG